MIILILIRKGQRTAESPPHAPSRITHHASRIISARNITFLRIETSPHNDPTHRRQPVGGRARHSVRAAIDIQVSKPSQLSLTHCCFTEHLITENRTLFQQKPPKYHFLRFETAMNEPQAGPPSTPPTFVIGASSFFRHLTFVIRHSQPETFVKPPKYHYYHRETPSP